MKAHNANFGGGDSMKDVVKGVVIGVGIVCLLLLVVKWGSTQAPQDQVTQVPQGPVLEIQAAGSHMVGIASFDITGSVKNISKTTLKGLEPIVEIKKNEWRGYLINSTLHPNEVTSFSVYITDPNFMPSMGTGRYNIGFMEAGNSQLLITRMSPNLVYWNN